MKSESIVFNILGTIVRTAVLIAMVYVIYQGAIVSFQYGFRIFAEPAMTSESEPAREITISVPEGVSPKALGETMESVGLIRDSKLFILQYYCSEYRKDLRGGEFTFSTAMTVEEMFSVMASEEKELEE